jgi:hypothetical protein
MSNPQVFKPKSLHLIKPTSCQTRKAVSSKQGQWRVPRREGKASAPASVAAAAPLASRTTKSAAEAGARYGTNRWMCAVTSY